MEERVLLRLYVGEHPVDQGVVHEHEAQLWHQLLVPAAHRDHTGQFLVINSTKNNHSV